MLSVRHSLVQFYTIIYVYGQELTLKKGKLAVELPVEFSIEQIPTKRKLPLRLTIKLIRKLPLELTIRLIQTKRGLPLYRAHYQAYSHRKKAVVKVTDHYENSA